MGRSLWLALLTLLFIAAAHAQSDAPKPDADGVYLDWKGVTHAKLVHAVPISVPQDPRLNGLKHVCAILVVIGADGTPGAMEVLNQLKTPLDSMAELAVKRSTYEPGRLEGRPVATRLLVWVPFLFGKETEALPVAWPANSVNGLETPVVLFAPEAEYTDNARRAFYNGVVVVQVLVTEKGLTAREQILVHAEYGLDGQALKEIEKWRFRPAMLDGVPVPIIVTIAVNFRMRQGG
ncbi:MAG TPA: TonB family protein [Terracidiphilus sp.]|nr:TonB family protein [Terracidiphilus sp.]